MAGKKNKKKKNNNKQSNAASSPAPQPQLQPTPARAQPTAAALGNRNEVEATPRAQPIALEEIAANLRQADRRSISYANIGHEYSRELVITIIY